ncbi:helix-turn-helix domain-containing protein [Candidatus Protochlamydia amoebophila]|nr:helix-turn-helix domain-containing protein [Candidatus Protochlamydia amoebophila]
MIDFLNIDEACEFLNLSRPTLYRYAKEGKIPSVKFGKTWRFHKKLLEEWLLNEMKEAAQRRAKQQPDNQLSEEKDIFSEN